MRSKKMRALITLALTVNLTSNLITPALAEEITKKVKDEIIILQEEKELEKDKKEDNEEKDNKIKEIRVNKKIFDVDEKIIFSLKLENKNVDKIIFEYLDDKNNNIKIDFKYNKENDRYESDFKVEKELENRILKLNKILLSENGKEIEYKQSNIKIEELTLKVNEIKKQEKKEEVKEEKKETSNKKEEVKKDTTKENKKDNNTEKDVKNNKKQNNKEYINDVVKNISADKKIAKLNEKIKISVEMDETKEKIENVECQYSVNSNQTESKWRKTPLKYNAQTKKYEGEIEITKEILNSEIILEDIMFTTESGNWATEYVGHKNIKIRTTNSNGVIDEKAPVIKTLNIDKKEAMIGEYINISVDAIDEEGSEIEVFCHYSWIKSNEWFNETVKLEYNKQTKKYEGKVKITEMMAKSKVDFGNISAIDEAKNEGHFENYEYDKYVVQISNEDGVIDKNPPIVNSVQVSKNEAKLNDEIVVSVEAEDKETSIKNVKYGYSYKNKDNGYNYDEINLKLNTTNKKYEGKIKITEDMLKSKITPNGVRATDEFENEAYYSDYDYEKMTILVADKNGVIDKNPPIVKSAQVSKNEVKLNDEVVVSVEAEDRETSIKNIKYRYGYTNRENQYKREEINLKLNTSNKKYEGKIKITEDMLKSKLSPNGIEAEDEFGNSTNYYGYEYEQMMILVANENGVIDKNSPIVKNIKVSKNEAKLNEEILVSVEAEDKETSIKNIRYNYDYTNINGEYRGETLELKLNTINNRYEGKIKITEDMLKSKIMPREVYAEDEFNNNVYYSENDYEKLIIMVADKNGIIDKNPPIIRNAQLSKNEAKLNDEILISVEAEDKETSIKNVIYTYMYIDVNGKEQWGEIKLKLNAINKKYEGKIKITENMLKSKIRCNSIVAEDEFDNTGYYNDYDDEKMIIFVADKNGVIDKNPPIIKYGQVNKNEAKLNDEILISVYAEDMETSIKDIYYKYHYFNSNGEEKYEEVNLKLNTINKKYEGKIKITKDMLKSKLIPTEVVAIDEFENINYYYDKNENMMIWVADEKGTLDRKDPTIESIKINKTEAKLGDKIKISVIANDIGGSGIDRVYYNYIIGDEIEEIELKFNSITKAYEGEILITKSMLGKKIETTSVDVYDKWENYQEESYYDDKSLIVHIENEKGIIDKIAPTLANFMVDRIEAKLGEKINFSVEARDKETGIKKVTIGYYVYHGDLSTDYEEIELKLNEGTKKYEFTLNITEKLLKSRIEIDKIIAEDNAQNITTIEGTQNVWIADKQGVIDKVGPIIKKVQINKERAKVGEEIQIEVDAMDAKSEIKEVRIGITSKEFSDSLNLNYNVKTNKYEGKYVVPRDAEGRYIALIDVTCTDAFGNKGWQSLNEQFKVYIEDEKGNINDKPIKIEELMVDKTKVKVGDKVNISLKVDNYSINDRANFYYKAKGARDTHVFLRYNKDKKCYEGSFTINPDLNGLQIEYKVNISNGTGNSYVITSEELGKHIQVEKDINIKNDNNIPILKSMKTDKQEYRVDETIKLILDIEDESKMKNIYTNISGDLKFKYNNVTKLYEATMKADEWMAGMEKQIENVQLTDEKNNTSMFKNGDVKLPKIKVLGENNKIDTELPKLINCNVSSKGVNYGTDIKISVEATDDLSGVRMVTYEYDDSSETKWIGLDYNEMSKKYEGIIHTENYIDGDTLNNGKITISDRAGNIATFINKSNLDIQVRGENNAIKENKKIIKNAELGKNITFKNEKIKLKIDLDVKPEEIKSVSMNSFIYNVASNSELYVLEYNEKTKMYECEISTDEIIENKGLFACENIKIIYKNGKIQNRTIFSRKDLNIAYSKQETGWHDFGGKVYTKDGKVVKGTQIIDGITYKFDEYGNLLGKENNKPVIEASDKILDLGDKFNPMDGIKANDIEDGDITSKIKILSNNVDVKKAGIYYVKYEVEDSAKIKVTKTIKVTVLSDKSDFKTNWAKEYIKKAMQNEWISTTEKFRPEDSITRAEFVKIVNRAFGYKEKVEKENFKDVTEKDWFYDDVKIALKAGYISNKLEKFRPNDNISREEAAAIITAITNTRDKNLDKLEKYKDKNKVSDWAKSSVEGVIEQGYMGRGSDMFRPKANITRAEAVVTLGRIK